MSKLLLVAALLVAVTVPTMRTEGAPLPAPGARPPVVANCNDIACIGGDWWTDLILTVNNYRETFKKLRWIRVESTMPPLVAGLDGAGWFWNTANTIHNLREGPWEVGFGIGHYCYRCGGWGWH